jgi:hypothetical protein
VQGADVEEADILSLTAFGHRMTQLGIRKHNMASGVFYIGLGINGEPSQTAIGFEEEEDAA